ncbi:hypothetical protein FPOAC2_03432 [Fusarium poae]
MEHAHQQVTATIMTLSGLKKTGTSERVDIRHGPGKPSQSPNTTQTPSKPNPIASHRILLACFLQAAIWTRGGSSVCCRHSRYLRQLGTCSICDRMTDQQKR